MCYFEGVKGEMGQPGLTGPHGYNGRIGPRGPKGEEGDAGLGKQPIYSHVLNIRWIEFMKSNPIQTFLFSIQSI